MPPQLCGGSFCCAGTGRVFCSKCGYRALLSGGGLRRAGVATFLAGQLSTSLGHDAALYNVDRVGARIARHRCAPPHALSAMLVTIHAGTGVTRLTFQ